MSVSQLALGVVVGVFVLALLWERLGARQDAREPPVVYSRIPFCGHLIGMLRHQMHYLDRLSAQNPSLPIFTIKIFGSRIYIINDAALCQLGMRNGRTLSFEPFIIETSCRMFALDERVKKILSAAAPDGQDTYMKDIHRAMTEPLSQGPALWEMNARALECLGGFLNNVGAQEQKKPLYRWIRDTFTEASAEALYGPGNPVRSDKSLIQSLWDFETDLPWLLLGVLPQLTAASAYKGREKVQKAFEKYYDAGSDVYAAGMIKERKKVGLKWNCSMKDIAHFDLSMFFVSTTNTVPSGFWLICQIFQDPDLVATIRAEIENIVTRETVNGVDTLTMDISRFQESTPLLVSAFQESFRLINAATSTRAVLEDTTLDSKYLLKKSGVIQMLSGPLHQSSEIWGADAHTFNAYRFLSATKDELSKEQRKKQLQGYFPFGGGKHLCPGRHFAFTEIVGMVATLVYGFEFRMPDGSPGITMPPQAALKMGTAVRKPAHDPEVLIRRRQGLENVTWAYGFQAPSSG
ncbi:prostacyclin synthase [Phlyctema vagabunda]|uniref:Prostacyclin synthase n=1 Tax=Phlyctema vagabunda TaxID=108571 RepID=A0ABR4P740_9HELO